MDLPGEGHGGVGLVYLSTLVTMYSCTHVLTVEADVDLPGEGDGGVGFMYLSTHVPMYSCTHVLMYSRLRLMWISLERGMEELDLCT